MSNQFEEGVRAIEESLRKSASGGTSGNERSAKELPNSESGKSADAAERSRDSRKIDLKKMIVYSEILKPKFDE